ncbi:hypothetical protein ACEPPN_009099 [Leptodophora sp. 'Broadleaf-Isolate-01']
MADPLSIAGSIAGLISIADVVIRKGYKYIAAVRDSDKAVSSLISEVNSLSGTLHSLRNVAEGLEGGSVRFSPATRIHHIESCFQTLKKIMAALHTFESSKGKGVIQRAAQRLKWPLSNPETKGLMTEVTRHRETLSLALNADEMSALIVLLARQEVTSATLVDIERGLQNDRAEKKAVEINAYRRKILEWLCPAMINPDRYQDAAASLRQPGTGVWFTESVEFQEWSLRNDSKLWLHGIPGAGKTILTSTIIQEVQMLKNGKNNEGNLFPVYQIHANIELTEFLALAFFYCDYKDVSTHVASNILGSIIKQLVLTNETAFKILVSFYEDHSQPFADYRSPDPESLLQTLHTITSEYDLTTIVIDGLDEIATKRPETVALLQKMQEKPLRIRTIFGSRYEADIAQCLRGFQHVSIMARSSDLELYVANEIETRMKKKELRIKDPDLKEQIMRRLVDGAEGMFRWVACQIDHLCQLPTDKARSKALDQLPRGLSETYEQILGRILERHEDVHDLVSRTLQWLAFAERPLGWRELSEALSITPGDTQLEPDSIVSEDEILRWCSSLVRRQATGNGIELAHYTVKDYLISMKADKNPSFALFKIFPEATSRLLGQVCLTYLNMDHLDQYPPSDDICDSIWSGHDYESSNDGSEYSDSQEEDIDLSADIWQVSNSLQTPKFGSVINMEGNGTEHMDSMLFEAPKAETKTKAQRPVNKSSLWLYAAANWSVHSRLHMQDPQIVLLSRSLFDVQKPYKFLWWTYGYMCALKGEQYRETYPDTTTLHWAAMLWLPELCSWLISQGGDVNRQSKIGTPLYCSLLGLQSTLFGTRSPTRSEPSHSLNRSLEHLQSTTVLRLIQGGADLCQIPHPRHHGSPLELALSTSNGNAELVSHLLDGGAAIAVSALQIVDEYINGTTKNVPMNALPPAYAILFSDRVKQNVSDTADSLYQRLSTQLVTEASLMEEQGSDLSGETWQRSQLLGDKFRRAAQHGACKPLTLLVSALRKSGSHIVEPILTHGLALALANNHENVVRLLLELGVDPNITDKVGDSPAHLLLAPFSVQNVGIALRNLESLVEYNADLSIRNNRGEQVIHSAARSSENVFLEAVFRLMNNDDIQKCLADNSPSPLQYAVMSGSDENVEFLLQKYQDINPDDHQSNNGTSLMGLAASRKTDAALRLLHERGMATDTLSSDGSSVLYHAAGNQEGGSLKFLLEIGATDDSSRADGTKAIHITVMSNYPAATDMLRALLDAGHDPNICTADEETPLYLTSLVGNIDRLQLLLQDPKTNVDFQDSQGMTCLMKYARDLAASRPLSLKHQLQRPFELLMNYKPNPRLVDSAGRTALHFLCSENITSYSSHFIKLLVRLGASLESKDMLGVSPFELLFCLCVNTEGGHEASQSVVLADCLKFAVENGSNCLNDLFSNGMTPLSFAIKNHSHATVDLLLSKPETSVDIRMVEHELLTSLELACWTKCTKEGARALLSRTHNPLSTRHPIHGYTILHFAACDTGDQTMLKELLHGDTNVDIEILNTFGETPLYIAIHRRNLASVTLLLESGADTSIAIGDPPILPLHFAAQRGQRSIVQVLVKCGADIHATSADTHSTALHYACFHGDWGLISFLIERGADVDARDLNGATPYLIAAMSKNWTVFRNFARTTADLNVRDFSGGGALHHAIIAGSESMIRLIERGNAANAGVCSDVRDMNDKIRGNDLTCAIESGHLGLFKHFWANAERNFTSDYGWTLAHFAVAADSDDVRILLLSHSIDWNSSTADMSWLPKEEVQSLKGLLPLHLAALSGKVAAIDFLKGHDKIIDINVATEGEEGYSSMHLAAVGGRPSTIQLLKRFDADLDLKAKRDGQTALHIAARLGYGMTPELLAIEHNHLSVAKVLGDILDKLESTIRPADGSGSESTSAIARRKLWRLPLAKSPHMADVMAGNVSIYAALDAECPEGLRASLEEHRDAGVYHLGRPFKRLI